MGLNHAISKVMDSIFSARSKKMELIPIFVKISEIIIEFWSYDVFKSTGNKLGLVYEIDTGFQYFGLMSIANILEGISQRGWNQWWKERIFSPLGKVQFQ
jgi:hypothetical protein